ncbi:lysophospholipase-like protein 1 [Aplysia californica]|uniref:palmitoyl-protein hydrolase n=1 Tax=Aplysia californica TaxID=6500 RepID=A0ABM0ZY81_APLCA|nr:lysophospholipase-like protein 1 [Aplysia californica]
MALHLALRYHTDVGAVVSLSTFMYHNSEVYRHLQDVGIPDKLPPFLFCHGDVDNFVDLEWGKTMHRRFGQYGVTGHFETIPGLKHTVNKPELDFVKSWVMENMP